MPETIKEGKESIDFTLKDQSDKEITLSDFKNQKVLLSFHPLAWTSVCAEHMQLLEENYKRFEKLNTIPFGISVDTVPSKNAWSIELGIESTRILSDFWPHGETANAYGIFNEEHGTSERANVIIDENQKVSSVKVYPMGEVPDINEILDKLE